MDNVTNIEPADNEERLLKGILEGDAETNIEPAGNKERLLKGILEKLGGGGSGLPDVTAADNDKVLLVTNGAWGAGLKTELSSQTSLVLEPTEVEAIWDLVTFIKCSNIAPTETQLLNGEIISQGTSIPITTEVLVPAGQHNALALLRDPQDTVPLMVFVYEADETFPETGTYFLGDYIAFINLFTLVYPDTITAQARPIAFGTSEYESGVTDMPSGTVYFQIEG